MPRLRTERYAAFVAAHALTLSPLCERLQRHRAPTHSLLASRLLAYAESPRPWATALQSAHSELAEELHLQPWMVTLLDDMMAPSCTVQATRALPAGVDPLLSVALPAIRKSRRRFVLGSSALWLVLDPTLACARACSTARVPVVSSITRTGMSEFVFQCYLFTSLGSVNTWPTVSLTLASGSSTAYPPSPPSICIVLRDDHGCWPSGPRGHACPHLPQPSRLLQHHVGGGPILKALKHMPSLANLSYPPSSTLARGTSRNLSSSSLTSPGPPLICRV